MQVQQWILFFAGLAVIFVGVCLMAYSVAAKRAFAGAKTKQNSVAQIIDALGGILKIIGDWFGANMAAKVGFILVLLGFGLLYVCFRVA
jgi:hypothetical protein